MRQVLIRTAFKGLIILIGILLICTILQFMIWLQGSEPIVSTVLEPSGDPDWIKDVELRVHQAMGMDHIFVPDLWPFDNESLWHRAETDPR